VIFSGEGLSVEKQNDIGGFYLPPGSILDDERWLSPLLILELLYDCHPIPPPLRFIRSSVNWALPSPLPVSREGGRGQKDQVKSMKERWGREDGMEESEPEAKFE
jgi:hypothetical protein